jgi:hypothetical protein
MKAPCGTIHSIGSAMRIGAALTIVFLAPGATRSEAAGLQEGTLQAWAAYVRTVDSMVAERAAGEGTFLWVDESPELGRRVRAGEVLVASRDLDKVPGGLIHHWVGAMFLPNVTLEEVTRVLDDYDRYAEFYRPIVVKSQLLKRTDDYENVRILMTQRAFGVTAAVETDDQIRIMKLDADRICSVSDSIRVQEVVNYGRQDERLLPEGQGPGFVWRTFGVTRLEQRDGGVYLEMETIALSRGIPLAFRWLIKPLTERLPRNIMFEMLNDTGAAVRRETESTSTENQIVTQGRAPVTNGR